MIIITTVHKIPKKNGRPSLKVSSGEQPMMEEVAYKADPTGGVMMPLVQHVIIISPKWTGSTPMEVTTGRRIGVIMRQITVV